MNWRQIFLLLLSFLLASLEDEQLTKFHLSFHLSHEAGVEWNDAKWVAVEVDEINEFLSIKTFRHLGICIYGGKSGKK